MRLDRSREALECAVFPRCEGEEEDEAEKEKKNKGAGIRRTPNASRHPEANGYPVCLRLAMEL